MIQEGLEVVMRKHFLLLKFVGYECVQFAIQYLLSFNYRRPELLTRCLLGSEEGCLECISILCKMIKLLLFGNILADHGFCDFCRHMQKNELIIQCFSLTYVFP